jgi:hypothetical protein
MCYPAILSPEGRRCHVAARASLALARASSRNKSHSKTDGAKPLKVTQDFSWLMIKFKIVRLSNPVFQLVHHTMSYYASESLINDLQTHCYLLLDLRS